MCFVVRVYVTYAHQCFVIVCNRVKWIIVHSIACRWSSLVWPMLYDGYISLSFVSRVCEEGVDYQQHTWTHTIDHSTAKLRRSMLNRICTSYTNERCALLDRQIGHACSCGVTEHWTKNRKQISENIHTHSRMHANVRVCVLESGYATLWSYNTLTQTLPQWCMWYVERAGIGSCD